MSQDQNDFLLALALACCEDAQKGLGSWPVIVQDLSEALEAAGPFFDIARAVTDSTDPNYREWFAEAGDHCVAFGFAGSVITLGDLRAAARVMFPEREILVRGAPFDPENAPSGKA